MATTVDRLQLSHRRSIQRRYDATQRHMAVMIAMLLYQFARNGQVSTDTFTRMTIKAAIWAQVLRPYYIGAGTEPFDGADPQSPFATLVRDGVEGAMRVQVRRSIALLKRYIKDDRILAWFLSPVYGYTGLPYTRQTIYQSPFYAYVDPNGYKLNDRIMRNAIDARAKLDRMIDFHVARGTDVMAIGGAITNFMTISGRSTGLPYGDYGSYASWKMLRGEMLVAAGRATIIASLLNPVVDAVQWRLSPVHHDTDECDANANGGENGDGVYPPNDTPPYPSHPNCQCSIWPVSLNPGPVVAGVLAMMNNNREAQRIRGILNEEALTRALMTEQVGEPV